MAQARRKKSGKRTAISIDFNGFLLFAAGMVIGALVTILWQGIQTSGSGIGAGLREMMEKSRQQEQVDSAANQPGSGTDPVPANNEPQTSFDFFTVLPEIEVVVPDYAGEDSVPPGTADNTPGRPAANADAAPENKGSFMLQAGSYQHTADAERLRAELALLGLVSFIQKVTIQGRGDFYRVRLGPYTDHREMVTVDQRLGDHGIKALRLKVSRGG